MTRTDGSTVGKLNAGQGTVAQRTLRDCLQTAFEDGPRRDRRREQESGPAGESESKRRPHAGPFLAGSVPAQRFSASRISRSMVWRS